MDAKNVEKTKQIFADMEPMARKELDAELKSESSDIQKIKDICGQVIVCARYTNDAAIIAQVEDAYNVNKILMGNPVEYVSKMPNPYADKAAELEGQIETIRQQAQQQIATLQQQIANLQQAGQEKDGILNRMTNELNTTKLTLQDAQNRNRTLNSENSGLRQENAALSASEQGKKQQLEQFKLAAQKLKGGMFGGSGIEEIKRLAAEIDR